MIHEPPLMMRTTALTPGQVKAARDGWCPACGKPSLRPREADETVSILQCTSCETVVVLNANI